VAKDLKRARPQGEKKDNSQESLKIKYHNSVLLGVRDQKEIVYLGSSGGSTSPSCLRNFTLEEKDPS